MRIWTLDKSNCAIVFIGEPYVNFIGENFIATSGMKDWLLARFSCSTGHWQGSRAALVIGKILMQTLVISKVIMKSASNSIGSQIDKMYIL